MDATRVSPRRFTKELVDERAPSPPSLQMLLHHPEPKPELHTRVSPTREHTHTHAHAREHVGTDRHPGTALLTGSSQIINPRN